MAQPIDPDRFTIPYQLTKTIRRDPYDEILPSKGSNSKTGEIIIVTGAYGGVGAAACLVWAQAGASVVLAGRKLDELAKVEEEIRAVSSNASAKFLSVSVDVTIESEVNNLFIQIQKTFGRHADVLFYSAGSDSIDGLMAQIPWDGFTNVVNTHFLGFALLSKYFVTHQPKPTDPVGTIIYITSGVGGDITPGHSSHSISKFASQRLVEYLDAEYSHLRAFTLAPGIPMTSMTREDLKVFAKDDNRMSGMMALYLTQERADFLRGSLVSVNWDIKEMERNETEITHMKLLKMKWIPARLGTGGHPFGGWH